MMASICIFGSHARRTADAISDRDVLIIAGTEHEIDSQACMCQTSGWNVTRFTEQYFSRMANAKALFVQHIKQESRIVQDDGSFLSQVLMHFSPKHDYYYELRDSLACLNWLPVSEGDYWPDLCLADISYVFLRNAAILLLASRQLYVFEYIRLIDHFVTAFQLSKSQRVALLQLRQLKHAYRNRRVDAVMFPCLYDVREVIRVLSKRLFESDEIEPDKLIDCHTYFRMRQIELKAVRRHDPRSLDRLAPGDPGFDGWGLICNPGGYPKPKGFDELSDDFVESLPL